MEKVARIRKNQDYQQIFRSSRWINGRWLTLHYRKGKGLRSRWGMVVSRRVGGAVVRNRVRRRLREICREFDPHLKQKMDLVVVGKKGIDQVDFWSLRRDFLQVCYRASVLRKEVSEENLSKHGSNPE